MPDDRERVGARCPNCRDPLYEPPGRFGRPVREGEGACSVHPECESVGPCGRCGNFMCETCRTRWRDQILCAACVDRVMESKEAAPEQSRTHLRQAILALGMGDGAWVLGVVGFVVAVLAAAAAAANHACRHGPWSRGPDSDRHAPGQRRRPRSASGRRWPCCASRGNHMILATIGLVVGGLYVGMFIGVIAMSIYANTLTPQPTPEGDFMLWEIEIRPKGADGERVRVAEEYDLLTHGKDGGRPW